MALAAKFGNNWACLEKDAAVHSQTLSALTEEAEACKSSSSVSNGSDEGRLPVVVHGVRVTSPWWAVRISYLTKHHPLLPLRRPLNIITGCTGISAEGFAFQAGSFSADKQVGSQEQTVAFTVA
jgi:hypothetical protein